MIKLKKTRYFVCFIIMLGVCLIGSGSAADWTSNDIYKSKHGVYYQIFVRAFADGRGDGLGDLRGIIENLDYLNDGNPHTKDDLGVTGLWLTPIHPSPTYHKYDVTDYYEVDPEIGTLEDFRELVQEAHSRGIRVIMDLVVNHTSSSHPWFAEACLDPNSPYRDYYIWADGDRNINERGPWGQKVWHPAGNDHYYGLFWDGMPDLNYDNPHVRAEIKEIAQFWIEQGVDGFRLDAAMHIFAHDEPERAHVWWNEFRDYVTSLKPDIYLVAEVWDRSNVVAPYYASFDSNFNFHLANLILRSVNSGFDVGIAKVVQGHHEQFAQYSPWFIDAPFLTNHDQDRVMSILNHKETAKMAASLYLTLPGNPFIYYGEEIGMKGVGADENKREPFKWYETTGPGQSEWRSSTFNVGQWQPSVEGQIGDETSLLSHYRNLIQLRESNDVLKYGKIVPLETENRCVVGFIREWEGQQVWVFHNLADSKQMVEIRAQTQKPLRTLYSDGIHAWTHMKGLLKGELAPQSSLILY